jgi:hypothetical protein
MKKALFILSFFLFVGTVSATTYSATSSDVQTEIKKDDDKKKKKKSKKKGKACTAEGKTSGGCCSGGTKAAPEKK